MIAFSCSVFNPGRSSTCASGSCVRSRSRPSCAMRSVISILIASVVACTCVIPVFSPRLALKAYLAQAQFYFIHRLYEISLFEEAEVSNAEDFACHVVLPTREHHVVLLTKLLEQSFCV